MTGSEQRRSWRTAAAARVAAVIEAEEAHWFLWLPVVFAVGIALYFAAPSEPPMAALAAAFVTGLVLRFYARAPALVLVTTALAALTAGAFGAKLRTELVRAPILMAPSGPVSVTGWLERVEPRAGGGQRLTVRVETFGRGAADAAPYRIRVRYNGSEPSLRPGDALRFTATLLPPPEPAVPGDFDFGRLAYFSALGAFGSVTGTLERIATELPRPWSLRLLAPVEQLRQAIRERIVAALPGEAGEIATALITGERGGITEETNQAYRNSGLFHILSISGLHMVIMAGAVFYLLRASLALIPSIALTRPIKAWAAFGAIVGAFGYLLISGGSFATVRSWIMITIMFAAVIADRPALALRNVALAALLILVLWPESLFDAGFQMSFAAVVGLVAAFEALRARRQRRSMANERRGAVGGTLRFFAEIVLSTIVASIVVAPFGIYHFHNTQLLAMVANVLAIPVCNLIVMPAALGVLLMLPFGLEAGPLWVMGYGIEAMSTVARWVGALPGAIVKVPAIPTVAFALMVGGGLWLLLFSTRLRALGIIPLAIGLALTPMLQRPDLLIARDGTTVAVRGEDGRLSALAVRARSFDLMRWLERDGDARPPDTVAEARAFRCDGIGCVARVRGKVVTVALSPAALEDDCARAAVVVLRATVPRGCGSTTQVLVIDQARTAAEGAHALYLSDAGIRMETVARLRGQRPWSTRLVPASEPPSPERTSGFTALFERFRGP